jgi:hypothetical protein
LPVAVQVAGEVTLLQALEPDDERRMRAALCARVQAPAAVPIP